MINNFVETDIVPRLLRAGAWELTSCSKTDENGFNRHMYTYKSRHITTIMLTYNSECAEIKFHTPGPNLPDITITFNTGDDKHMAISYFLRELVERINIW